MAAKKAAKGNPARPARPAGGKPFFMRLHEDVQQGSLIVALCDRELIGKVLESGSITLDLKTYEKFYRGDETAEAVAAEALRIATSMNLVGEKSVALAVSLGFASGKEARKIGGVPHVQVYRV